MPVVVPFIPLISAVVGIAGAGLAAYSTITAGQQQQKAARANYNAQMAAAEEQRRVNEAQRVANEQANQLQYQSDMLQRQGYAAEGEAARRNQKVAEDNAQATMTAAAFEENQARIKAAKLAGTQAAGFAKAGVLMEGTPLDVMVETAALEEQDILANQYNYQVQAQRYRSQGDFYGFEAERQNRLANMPIIDRAVPYVPNVTNPVEPPNYMTGSYLKAGTSLLTTGASLVNSWKPVKSTYNPNQAGSGWGGF